MPTTLTRPGVYIDTSSFPTYVSSTPGDAVACFIGMAPRGPMTATVVTSWKDFVGTYGGFELNSPVSPLHLAVYSYFSAGGTAAVVIRVNTAASLPVAAKTTISDQAATPLPTLTITAANPGSWSNNLYIDITPGAQTQANSTPTTPALTFNIVVHYLPGGVGTPGPGNVVEQWLNLSMVQNSNYLGQSNYALPIVNNPYTGSNWIVLSQPAGGPSTSTPPANNPKPTATATQLSGGLDGTGSPPAVPPVPQPTDYQTAFGMLDQFPDQPFVVNLCGQYDPTIVGPIVGLAQNRGNVFLVLDPPPGYTPTAMQTWALNLSFRTEKAAVYYPQVVISDPYSPTQGATRTIPPGGFVAGTYIQTDQSRGVAKAPAGLGTSLLGVYGVESSGIMTNTDQGNLNQANVNCLISVPGSGVVIWGARTLSAYLVTRYVSVERSIIYLSSQMIAMTKFAVFEPNDWILWNHITSVLSQFLNEFWQSGGLSGMSANQAFYVTCDGTNNTISTIQQGIVNVEVGVSLQFPAEFVVIKIGQWAGGQSVSVTNT